MPCAIPRGSFSHVRTRPRCLLSCVAVRSCKGCLGLCRVAEPKAPFHIRARSPCPCQTGRGQSIGKLVASLLLALRRGRRSDLSSAFGVEAYPSTPSPPLAVAFFPQPWPWQPRGTGQLGPGVLPDLGTNLHTRHENTRPTNVPGVAAQRDGLRLRSKKMPCGATFSPKGC